MKHGIIAITIKNEVRFYRWIIGRDLITHPFHRWIGSFSHGQRAFSLWRLASCDNHHHRLLPNLPNLPDATTPIRPSPTTLRHRRATPTPVSDFRRPLDLSPSFSQLSPDQSRISVTSEFLLVFLGYLFIYFCAKSLISFGTKRTQNLISSPSSENRFEL